MARALIARRTMRAPNHAKNGNCLASMAIRGGACATSSQCTSVPLTTPGFPTDFSRAGTYSGPVALNHRNTHLR